MICFQRIGWCGTILPKDRKSSTLSDGAIFSSREVLERKSAEDGFHILSVREVELSPDDPQIDFFLQGQEEQDRRLEEWRRRQA